MPLTKLCKFMNKKVSSVQFKGSKNSLLCLIWVTLEVGMVLQSKQDKPLCLWKGPYLAKASSQMPFLPNTSRKLSNRAELKILTGCRSTFKNSTIQHTISTTPPRHQDMHCYNTRNASNFSHPAHQCKKPSYSKEKLLKLIPEEI